MRITFIYDAPIDFVPQDAEVGLAGTENSLIRFSSALASLGHEINVYNHCTHPGRYDQVQWHHVRELPQASPCDAIIYYKRVPEVIKLTAPVRCIVLTDRTVPCGLGAWLEQGLVNLVIATSRWQYECARQSVAAPDEKWFCSGLGIITTDYANGIAKEPGLCIYTTVPYRGLDVLLDIWPRIKRQAPHANLQLVSSYLIWGNSPLQNEGKSGPLYEKARALAPLGVTNVIESRGGKNGLGYSEMIRLMQKSQCFLYPSTYDDSFCLAALEAAAAGVVIVTSRRAALSERVIDGVTGYLIEGDPASVAYQEKFAERTVSLLNESDTWASMSHNARILAADHEITNLVRQWVDRFLSVSQS